MSHSKKALGAARLLLVLAAVAGVHAAQPLTITTLSTYTRTAGTNPFSLGVTGTGFVAQSVVQLNGMSLPTTYFSDTSLTATFPTVAIPGQVSITVLNPGLPAGPAPSTSEPVQLTILPQPTAPSLSPASANAGGPGFVLTATGTNYLAGMTLYFNSVALPASFNVPQDDNDVTQLIATIPAALIATAGTVPVWVATVDGFTTPAAGFTIITAVPPLQLLTSSPLPGGVVNTPYSVTLMAAGGTGADTFAVVAGTLPGGLTLSTAGLLNGTPAAFGGFQFTVQVTDSTGLTAFLGYTLNISPAPLTLTTGPLGNTPQNTPVSIQFTGSGGKPPYTFVEFGALPPGTQIGSGGLLSGTPTQAGVYPFLLFIDDSAGASASQKYSLTVTLPGLVITTASPLPHGQLAVPYTTSLAATGGKGAPYTWSAAGLPPGLTIANTTGLIAGIPRQVGTFIVGVTVGDSGGQMVTQNYTLVIASSTLTVTGSLPNGAAGSSYSANLAASGGSAPYTFTATGLPAGVTVAPNGIFSGTPTATGSFNIAVTATDSLGVTANAIYTVTIAAKLVVTGTTISNAVLGSPISVTTLSASGGTAPYQWQAANPAPGLSLAPAGTLTGTPTAAGTFSFIVQVVDNNGAMASGTVQVIVALPAAPAVTIGGLPSTNAPATQPSAQITLAGTYPVALTANLTLTFAPTSGPDDPSIQFSTGGRTAQIVVPANTTGGLTAVGVQTGTVAGTITITVHLLAGAQDVTPSPAPTRSIVVNPAAPVITGVTATRTGTGFTVVVTGYSSTRDLASGMYQFAGSAGADLLTGQIATPLSALFTTWYQGSASAPYGSQFSLTQPFSVSGSASTVLSVTVTLTNSIGTSPAAMAYLQ